VVAAAAEQLVHPAAAWCVTAGAIKAYNTVHVVMMRCGHPLHGAGRLAAVSPAKAHPICAESYAVCQAELRVKLCSLVTYRELVKLPLRHPCQMRNPVLCEAAKRAKS
jgi:hypothetical protein